MLGKLDVSTGIIFSIYTIGQMAGSLYAGWLCDRFGRRAGMFTGEYTSQSVLLFLSKL